MSNPDPSLHLEILQGQPAAKWRDRLVDMWLSEGVITSDEAERRVREVVCALLDGTDRVLGVTTAYPGRIPKIEKPVWFLRMFIRKSIRGASGLKNRNAVQWEMFQKTCVHLQETNQKSHLGVVMVTENRKLWSERWQKRLGEKGWELLGRDPRGNIIYLLKFPE